MFLDIELRFRRVANLPRGIARRFGALRKLLVAATAGIRDVIDDAVRIIRPTQRRRRMSGPAAGLAFRLAAQAEDAFPRNSQVNSSSDLVELSMNSTVFCVFKHSNHYRLDMGASAILAFHNESTDAT